MRDFVVQCMFTCTNILRVECERIGNVETSCLILREFDAVPSTNNPGLKSAEGAFSVINPPIGGWGPQTKTEIVITVKSTVKYITAAPI